MKKPKEQKGYLLKLMTPSQIFAQYPEIAKNPKKKKTILNLTKNHYNIGGFNK